MNPHTPATPLAHSQLVPPVQGEPALPEEQEPICPQPISSEDPAEGSCSSEGCWGGHGAPQQQSRALRGTAQLLLALQLSSHLLRGSKTNPSVLPVQRRTGCGWENKWEKRKTKRPEKQNGSEALVVLAVPFLELLPLGDSCTLRSKQELNPSYRDKVPALETQPLQPFHHQLCLCHLPGQELEPGWAGVSWNSWAGVSWNSWAGSSTLELRDWVEK